MKIKKLINGYGIKELNIENDDKELGNAIIYSSNGTFKSSFSSVLDNLSKGTAEDSVFDRLSVGDLKKLECEIEIDGKVYTQKDKLENILVYSKENVDADWTKTNDVSRLIVSKEYQKIISELKESIDQIKKYYNTVISNLKIEKAAETITGVVQFSTTTSIDDLEKNINILKNITEKLIIPKGFEIKSITQKAYETLDDKTFVKEASALVKIVEKEMKSTFFGDGFSIDNINSISDSLELNNFLNQNRKILITKEGDEKVFDNINDFKKFVNNEIELIIEKSGVALEHKKALEKKLGKSKAADSIKKQINDIEWMNFYSKGRREIVNTYIANNLEKKDLEEHLAIIQKLKSKNTSLKEMINKNQSDFEEALKIHRERFKPPFSIEICNKSDVVLGTGVPQFKFYPNASIECEKNYSETRNILSSGEKNAFDIINLIVKYETISHKDKLIVILDDIVETFDYSNRIAFIEYIQDMAENKTKIIVLTHNYEFFRTLQARLDNSFKKLSAYNEKGIVNISSIDEFYFTLKGMLKVQDMSHLGSRKNLSYKEYFISTFPFVREVSEFIGDSKPLTYLFHYKTEHIDKEVKQVVVEIKGQVKNYTIQPNAANLESCEDNYYDFIYSVCDEVAKKEILPYDIYRKIILSIGCRLKAEKYMINGDFSKISNIKKEQTKKLLEQEKNNFSSEGISLVKRVLLSSSEFIHLNAFMYEPLIDINPRELIELYNDLTNIGTAFYK